MTFDPVQFWLLFNLGLVTKLLYLASRRGSETKEF